MSGTFNGKYKVGKFRKLKGKIKLSQDAKQNRKIKKLGKQVKRLSKADETKWLDKKQAGSISTTGTVFQLTALNVWSGTNVDKTYTRSGNSINVVDYKVRGLVQIPFSSVTPNDDDNRLRLMVVQIPNGDAVPSISEILEALTIDSFLKIKGNIRYNVMYDRTFHLTSLYQTSSGSSSAVGSSYEPWRVPIKFSLKHKLGKTGTKISYTQVSGSGDNAFENGMFMIALSDSAAATHPTISLNTRLRFMDN